MNTLARAILKTLAPKARIFERSTENPVKTQKKVLFEYLSRNRNTEYGKKYGFSGIRTISDYQKLVPMSDCDILHPYLTRMTKGEPNILTYDKPVFFGVTSGTTAKPKLIPVTKYSKSRKMEVMNLWGYYAWRDHPKALAGKILAVISSEIEGFTESKLPYGAESGHAYKNLMYVFKNFYALPYQVFDIMDYEARYYCILRIAMEQNITSLDTLNPSTLIILCEKIKGWKEKIIEDIEKGALNKNINLPENIRKILERPLKPNPVRARVLRRILAEKKELLPKYFWPDLELIGCWKAGPIRLYLKELPGYFGNTAVRDLGCLSTEARSSIPMSDDGAAGVLAIGANFYEFIPKEDMRKEKKRFLLCDQLEKGKEYFLVVTTPGGLYRYNIDDIITVDGFFNKTPMIEFVQKGLNASSLAGEKLYESHICEAINKAAEKNKLLIEFFSACPRKGNPPGYVFLVEFEKEPPLGGAKALLKSIEEELYNQNAEYRDKRRQQLLRPPVLKIVKKGDFEKYRAKKIREGAHDSQFKVPELTSDPDFPNNFRIDKDIDYID
ncbi:MAG: GH3 auxin-responsive promoter family protein [Candidatus Omnitrophica bacterium]|nr:GH3 auxin-responsive promoter family protein [Candidatus Omnitrophota bacterium]